MDTKTSTTNEIKIHNKSDKPQNVVRNEYKVILECEKLEKQMPSFLRGFFAYLKGNVLPKSRRAYLQDLLFFFNYLIDETDLTLAKTPKDIQLEDLNNVKAVDVNIFIDYCRNYKKERKDTVYIYENNNKTLSRKKSSVSILFKQLYREELVDKNITDGFNPIKVPKAQEREIKALQENEVMIMLDAVTTGEGLTNKELQYWQKTKKRDKAILIIFVTYGLRLTELQQLNVDSFNFVREEFKIYRKRGKESIMPLSSSVKEVILDYIKNERPSLEGLENINKDARNALFLSLQHKRMTTRQIRELVKKYTSIAIHTSRSNGYSPHKLRATTATSLISRGNSIYDVAALLDHEQVTTTQLYAKRHDEIKRELVNDIDWGKS